MITGAAHVDIYYCTWEKGKTVVYIHEWGSYKNLKKQSCKDSMEVIKGISRAAQTFVTLFNCSGEHI